MYEQDFEALCASERPQCLFQPCDKGRQDRRASVDGNDDAEVGTIRR
jgi:hypothetical protein